MIGMVIAALAAGLASPIAVQLPAPWHDWTEARPITLPPVQTQSLVRFALPEDVYGQSRTDLADLRVVDSLGAQQPFAIDQAVAQSAVTWREAALSEQGYVPGRYSQAVADAGTAGGMHDLLTLETSADEFSTWVEVAASDDDRTWRIVRQRAPIFRFTTDGYQGSLKVSYAPTKSRWLRVRVLDASGAFPITGCRIARSIVSAPETVIVASGVVPDATAPPKQTRMSVDLGQARAPVSQVRFDVENPQFRRAVAVLASADGTNWNDVYDGEIYRDDQGGSALSFDFPESRGRYWRLIVYDRDDAPLQGLRAALLAIPRYVSFRAKPGAHYRLIFGNPRALPPDYDLAASTSADNRMHAPLAALGRFGAAANPIAPIVPQPWTETHAGVLWAALLLAVAVLAWLAFRAMKGPDSSGTQ